MQRFDYTVWKRLVLISGQKFPSTQESEHSYQFQQTDQL